MDRARVAAWTVAIGFGLVGGFALYVAQLPNAFVPARAVASNVAFALPIAAGAFAALYSPDRAVARASLAAASALILAAGAVVLSWMDVPDPAGDMFYAQWMSGLVTAAAFVVTSTGWAFRATRGWTLALRIVAAIELGRLASWTLVNASVFSMDSLRTFALTNLLLGAIPLAALALALPLQEAAPPPP